MAEESAQYPIIDSHIHLYPSSELSTLAWCTPTNPLNSQHSLDEYAAATGSPRSLEGFIFLETDRKHDLESGEKDGSGWEMPLMEVEWLKRIALGKPRKGEGHTEEQKKLCLAIIPWAPVPSGGEVLERYLKEVEKHAEGSFAKIQGFRYLVQDKERGTMLKPGFVDGLKWLGRKGYVFDLGVDQHSGGKWQLEEAVEMIEKAHEGVPEEEKVTFIISKSTSSSTHSVFSIQREDANAYSRSPLQTRSLSLQPNRSLLHSLANSHVPPQQMQQDLHEAQRLFLRNA